MVMLRQTLVAFAIFVVTTFLLFKMLGLIPPRNTAIGVDLIKAYSPLFIALGVFQLSFGIFLYGLPALLRHMLSAVAK